MKANGSNDARKFHKNLFLDNIESDDSFSSCDEYSDDENDVTQEPNEQYINEFENEYEERLEESSKYYKFNHIPTPLTGNLVLFVHTFD